MFTANQSEDKNHFLLGSVNKFTSTVTSLASGIQTIVNQNELTDTNAWFKMWTKATQEEESDSEQQNPLNDKLEEGGAQERKDLEKLSGGGAAAESQPTKSILETLTDMQSTLMEALFRGEKKLEEEMREPTQKTDEKQLQPAQAQSGLQGEGREGAVKESPVLDQNNIKKIFLEKEHDPRGWLEAELKPPSTTPIQNKQEEIKQWLEAKINEGVTTVVDTTEKETFEHKVKNLYTIFSELKYKEIDKILQKTTSTSYTPQEKIDEVKKFQENFRMDLRIENENGLQDALILLNTKIKKNSLVIEEVNLTTPKFTPTSYNQTELLNQLIHSKHYLDGILQDAGINAENRITAAKLFVKQLELVSDPSKSGMANMHKQFAQYQAEESSYDPKKFVAKGVEFAKSIEAESTKASSPTSFLDLHGQVVSERQRYFHNSVVLHEVPQRDLVIRKFTERLSGLSSA